MRQFPRRRVITFGIFITVMLIAYSSFTVLEAAQPRITVGSGTPASCTEAALDAALLTGGTITFNCGGAVTITFTSTKTISLNRPDATIDGGGVITFSGNNARQLFRVNSGKRLKLLNLTLQDGNHPTNGGAINNSGFLDIHNSTLISHQSGNNGGAIANSGNLNLSKVSFEENSTEFDGGAIFNDSGALLNILGSTFSSNITDGSGGAIYVNGEGSTVNIANSTFVANSAPVGGAVYAFGANAAVNITHSTFSGNSAPQSASALGKSVDAFISVRSTILTASVSSQHCSPGILEMGGNIVHGQPCEGIANPVSTGDPLLGTLTGFPAYFPLNAGSPAINAAENCTYLSVGDNPFFSEGAPVAIDQRWFARPAGGTCDSGAYEANAIPAVLTITPTPSNTATITNTSAVTATPEPPLETETPTDLPTETAMPGATDTETATLDVTLSGTGSATPEATMTADLSTQSVTATATDAGTSSSTPAATSTGTISTTPTLSTPDGSIELLLNGGFETDSEDDNIPDGWTQKTPSGDKRKCNKDGKPATALEGVCVYQFKGGIGESSKLQQTVPVTSINSGETITLGGFYTASGSVNAKVKLRVKYIDPLLGKGKVNVNIVAAESYTPFTGELSVLLSGEPQTIKIQAQNKSTSGKVRFDMLSLKLLEVSLLPLP